MPLLVPSQRTPEWHAAHFQRVTASVAAACLGVGPDSRQKAWRSILGQRTQAESRPNRFQQWGVDQEPRARLAYEIRTGLLVEETGFWVHPSLDWLGASPDGLVGEGLLELKCPDKLPVRVPTYHRIQMLIQLAVCERPWCDYFCWTPDGVFCQRVYPAGTAGLIVKLARFRNNYVLTNTQPPRGGRRKP